MRLLKTFRRDKLRRLVEAGKVELVSAYHYDDMGDRRTRGPMKVAMHPADWRDCSPGICYLRPSQFTTESGRCYEASGIVTLIVHSNSNYDFLVRS